MKVRHPLLLAVGVLIGAAVLLSPVRIARRVKTIDLGMVYPHLNDFSGGRRGCVVKAFEYPTRDGGGHYSYQVHDGYITILFELNDLDDLKETLRSYESAPTSQPIGDQSFFFQRSPHNPEDAWGLAYQRHNVRARFSFTLTKSVGPDFMRSGEYKHELEKGAKLLDTAIQHRDSCVKIEDLRVYQVVAGRAKLILAQLLFSLLIFYSRLFHRDWSF